jgi:hypothetical protein
MCWNSRTPCCTNARRLEAELGRALVDGRALLETRPGLASDSAIFVDAGDLAAMDRCSSLVQRALASPAFLRHVEAQAPAIARIAPPNPGVLLGFDFHLGGALPQLIEINTNPGGLLINLQLARAVSACCEAVAAPLRLCLARGITQDELPARIVGSFRKTWADARGSAPLATVAIVDDDPAAQYLYPEFRLFERMFRDAGLEARIVDRGGSCGSRAAGCWRTGWRSISSTTG